jgi:DNA-binding response OmpR family regulator
LQSFERTMSESQPRGRVLVAEDDDDIRFGLVELLRAQGYQVIPLRDGAALLDALASSLLLDRTSPPPDLVVSDVRMPGFNGLSILEGLRFAGWLTPYIIITAFGDDESKRRAEKVGATAFFDKPLDFATLERLVGDVVERERSKSRDARRALAAIWEDAPLVEAVRCLRDEDRSELVVVRKCDEEIEAWGVVTTELLLDRMLAASLEGLSSMCVGDVAFPWMEDADPNGLTHAVLGDVVRGKTTGAPAIVHGKPSEGAVLAYITRVDSSTAR